MWTSKDCLLIALHCGGSCNISSVASCFTRVHVSLLDVKKASSEKLSTISGVHNVLVRGNEMQMVVGIDAPRFAALLSKTLGK